jgi:hypothetical protein
MKKLLGALALLAALMALGVAAATAGTGGADRPFQGTLAGSAAFLPDSTCPPTDRRTWSEASGTASHLGRVTMVSNHCTPPANALTGGRMTFVAANGDELYMTYSGTCSAPPFPPVGEVFTCTTDNVIVGGTGRFADATGLVHITAHVTNAGFGAPEWPVTWTWVGTLGY